MRCKALAVLIPVPFERHWNLVLRVLTQPNLGLGYLFKWDTAYYFVLSYTHWILDCIKYCIRIIEYCNRVVVLNTL